MGPQEMGVSAGAAMQGFFNMSDGFHLKSLPRGKKRWNLGF